MNTKKNEKQRARYMVGFVLLLSLYSFSDTIPGVPKLWETKNQWCWAASSECVIKYYLPDIGKTQVQIAGVVTNQNKAVDPKEIIKCVEENGKKAGLRVNMIVKPLSWEQAKAEADAKRPFIIMIRRNSGGYHCMVFAGYIKDQSKIKVMDPLRKPGTWVYRSFQKQVTGSGWKWERTYLVSASTPISSNKMASLSGTTSFRILTQPTNSSMSTVTFLFNRVQNGSTLNIYNAFGECLYECAIEGNNSHISWNKQKSLSSGIYYAVVKNSHSQSVNFLDMKSFNLLK